MVNGINGATTATTLNTKLQKLADDSKITKEEAANLTQAELQEIQDANPEIEIEDGVEEIVAANAAQTTEETEEAEETVAEAAANGVEVAMPAENIDAEATEQLKAEIEKAKDEYEAAKAEAELRKEDIDAAEDAYEALQADMAKAASDVEDAAANAQESVSQQTNRIRQQAQEEGWDETRLQQELGKISIPSISGEQRTLESVGIDVTNMAETIKNLSDLYAAQANTVDEIAQRYGGFLEVDLDTISVATDGTIVINEIGEGGPEVSGEDGISAQDMQKFANMTNDELTEYLASEDGAAIMTAMQGLANDGVDLSAENCAAIIKTMIAEQDKSTGDADKFGSEYAGKIQVNQINGVDSSQLSEAVKKVEAPKTETSSSSSSSSCDPYVIKIDGVEYTMILDNGDGEWNTDDILGINDQKDNLFEALKGLESDGDTSKLTGEELQKAGIRLVAKNDDGTLAVDDPKKDFDLTKIDNIDMTNLTQSTDNDGNIGTFGNFDVTLTDGRTIQGAETFEEMSTLEKLFGAVKNFFDGLGNIATNIIEKLMMNQDEKQYYSEEVKEKYDANLKEANELLDDTTAIREAIIDQTEENVDDAAKDYEEPETQEATEEDIFGEESDEEQKKKEKQQKEDSIF